MDSVSETFLGEQYQLDGVMEETSEELARRWAQGALRAIAGVLLLFGIGSLVSWVWRPGAMGFAIATLVAELLFGLIVYLAVQPAVRLAGSWNEALGLRVPSPRNGPRFLTWFVLQSLARGPAVGLLLAFVPAFHHKLPPGNTTVLLYEHALALALLLVTGILLAPIIEEFAISRTAASRRHVAVRVLDRGPWELLAFRRRAHTRGSQLEGSITAVSRHIHLRTAPVHACAPHRERHARNQYTPSVDA